MASSFHQIMSGLTAATRRPNRRSRLAPPGDCFQEFVRLRVIPDVHAMLRSFPFPPTDAGCRDRAGQLVSAVVVAFVQGDLKPGDPLPDPCELARAHHLPRHEVLTAIGYLLSHRILEQDRSGALSIHRGAAPTIEMKQYAFLARARQLVGEARQWHLPIDCLDPLFHRAAHEKS
jgi:DNA-binding transcriptional regulator YhcF (GntR family)